MGPANPPPKKTLPRWLVVIVFASMTSLLIFGGLVFLINLHIDFALFIAVPIGLIVGLLAGRYYGAAGAVGATFEAVVSIFAAIASVIGAIFAAFSV